MSFQLKCDLHGQLRSFCSIIDSNISLSKEASNKGDAEKLSLPYRLEAASCSMSENGPTTSDGLDEGSRATETSSPHVPTSSLGKNSTLLMRKASKRIRAQPRRPSYLTESFNLHAMRKTHLFGRCSFIPNDSSVSYGGKNQDKPEIISKFLDPNLNNSSHILKDLSKTISQAKCTSQGDSLCHTSTFALECLSDPKLIREELLWTENMLCNFKKLEEKLSVKEAELFALRNKHDSGCSKFSLYDI
jgi:hypothetical protein